MIGWVSKIMGRSVRDLAEDVDTALGGLAHARGQLEAAREVVRLAEQDLHQAQHKVRAARDALFEAHPDLRPTDHQERTVPPPIDPSNPALLPGQDPSKFEMVEVDDDQDPRFTAGASPVSSSDSGDLPPIVWGEHE